MPTRHSVHGSLLTSAAPKTVTTSWNGAHLIHPETALIPRVSAPDPTGGRWEGPRQGAPTPRCRARERPRGREGVGGRPRQQGLKNTGPLGWGPPRPLPPVRRGPSLIPRHLPLLYAQDKA